MVVDVGQEKGQQQLDWSESVVRDELLLAAELVLRELRQLPQPDVRRGGAQAAGRAVPALGHSRAVVRAADAARAPLPPRRPLPLRRRVPARGSLPHRQFRLCRFPWCPRYRVLPILYLI